MVICPECRINRIRINYPSCSKCGWKGEVIKDIPLLISTKKMLDPFYNKYVQFYEDLASEDLESPLMDERYNHHLGRITISMMKNIDGKIGLDIGSGKGFLSKELSKRGAIMTALDISMNYLLELKKSVEFDLVAADAENIPFEDHFDFIVSTDVLEHVVNPGNFLYSLNKSLKPNGKIIIRVPIDENLLVYSSYLGCKYDFVHLRSYNKGLLAKSFNDAGFQIEKIKLTGHSLNLKLPEYTNRYKVLSSKIQRIRTYLSNIGVNEIVLGNIPTWIANLLSPPYVAILIAHKTHDIVPTDGTNFSLIRI